MNEVNTLLGIEEGGLEAVFRAVKRYGKPRCIRTDIEPVSQAKLLRITPWLLYIGYQMPWGTSLAMRQLHGSVRVNICVNDGVAKR